MATYKVLCWQDIPTQIKAEDLDGDVSIALPPKFMARIDQLAAQQGLEQSDDYLAQWRWTDEEERDGSAQDVAESVRAELEAKADW